MSKTKVTTTTEHWEWDDSERDWVPKSKVVKTEESDEYDPYGVVPWNPHRYTYPSNPWVPAPVVTYGAHSFTD